MLYNKNGSEIEDDVITEAADNAPEVAEAACSAVEDDNLEKTDTEAETEESEALEQSPANAGISADAAVNDETSEELTHVQIPDKELEDEDLLHRLLYAGKYSVRRRVL